MRDRPGDADCQAAGEDVESENRQVRGPGRLQGQLMEGAATHPGAGLELSEDQQGRDQRIRDVRGEVDLEPVQSE